MIFVSSPCALEMLCATGKDEKASKRIRGRNIAVAPLGLVFFPRMPQSKLFAAAEIPNLPVSENRVQRRTSQIVGCAGVGIARKLKFPPWQKSPRERIRGRKLQFSRNPHTRATDNLAGPPL